MVTDLIETKLHVPTPRAGLVERPRLTGRLADGRRPKVTLVSAPPGFGKSTLLATMAGDGDGPRGERPAWVSLDAADDDPLMFWRYVVTAIGRAAPGVGADAMTALTGPTHDVGAALAAVLNDLAGLEPGVVLVLDDLHVIERRDIHDDLAFLIDRSGPRFRVVMGTRADPPLPLSRWRVRGELLDVRAGDLRFTADEAATYLTETMGLPLDGGDVASLETRTEGWIAALQLAALSMQGRQDVDAFIDSFAGDDRYVVDYLVDEVLARQPAELRRFLLETSILDRLSGPVCDAVTGRLDGRAMLERIERANLFLVPLDGQRQWYRYHHLFADVLRLRLQDEDPASLPGLHRRASDWFAAHGERDRAVRHALAGDADRAADLIQAAMPDLRATRAEGTLRTWLEALPDGVLAARPALAAALAGARMQSGDLAGVRDLLDAAAAGVDAAGPGASATGPAGPTDPVAHARLQGELAMLQAGYARFTGDLAGTIEHARRALVVAAPDDHLPRGGAASLLGLAHWESGELEAAYEAFAAGMADLERGGLLADVIGGQVTLADLRSAQGRLGDALRRYQHGLALATDRPGAPLRGAADMHVGISDILRARNDLAGARAALASATDLGDEAGLPKYPARRRIAEARLLVAEGDLGAAVDALDAAEPVFFADFSPVILPIPALRARVALTQGRRDVATAWAASLGVVDRAADSPSYVDQYDLATLARLHLHEGRHGPATDLAGRLAAVAAANGWVDAEVDATIALALAAHAAGDRAVAGRSIGRALDLAEPEGAIRRFVDEGAPMAALLRAVRVGPADGSGFAGLVEAALQDPGIVRRAALTEPLSQRELEVLRLLATELSGPDIAAHLVVSLHTVRSHTKAIFAKLGVQSRRAAVRRATELDLLTPRR